MHPAIIELMIRFAENSVPIATGLVRSHIAKMTNAKIIDNYSQNIDIQQKILEKHNHGGTGSSAFNPNIPVNVGFHPIENHDHQKLESTNPPFVDVPDTGDLNQLHAEKWNQYWEKIYDLSDNADSEQVINTMRGIQRDIKKYPCPSCKENAKAHLKEMEQEGNSFTDVSTKKDAILHLCDFKNRVNSMLNKPEFKCNNLL